MDTSWLDRSLYPFASKYIRQPAGQQHYVDEGQGDPVVMVHGNPTWSFLYRHLILGLSDEFRCIAADHLGFGLSDKPYDFSYEPAEHAANLERLLDSLDLSDITLVVQDWGGPTGLSYAVNHPERVKNLVILNTWMWSVAGDRQVEAFSRILGGPVGRFLIRRFNFFARVVMKAAYGDKSRLTPEIHRHYLKPLSSGPDRKGCWVFPKQITASDSWVDSLWQKRENITGKPALILWGAKDPAFRKKELERWAGLFPEAKKVVFPGTGHYVQEEQGPDLVPLIRDFLQTG